MTSKREKLQYAYVFFADLLTMAVSVLLAWLITDGLFGVLIPYTSTDWLQTLCLLFVAFVVTFFFFDQDKNIVTRSENEEISLSLRFNIALGLVYAGCMLLAKATMLDSRYFAVTVPAVNAVLLPFSGTLEKLATLTVRDNDTVERIDDFQLLDERFLSNPAFAVEQCEVVTDRMAELTREAIFDAINLIDGGAYTQEMADRVEALETKIDRYEDKLGTYMVKLSRAKLSRKDGHTLSLLLHSISDFERISDHAVNLMDSVQEMHDKKMSFSSAAAGELHVFADAVRDIVNRSFDSFLHDDVKLAKTVEPLEACIDDINVNVKSRHIERLTTGQCTIELGFVLTDISTNFERVSDHCSNIAVYQIQVPKDEYDTHEYLQNVKHQEHAEFDREEMAYEKRYRLPDVAKVQTAEAGE